MTMLSRRSLMLAGGAAALAAPAVLAAGAAAQEEPDPYFFSLVNAPDSPIPGGIVHRCTRAVFPVLQGVAVFSLVLDEGATRQPHMHTNANELSYIGVGSARAGIVGPNGQREEFDLAAGDLVFFPQGWMHWLANTGTGPLFALFMYSHEQPVTIDLADINARVPHTGY